MPEFTISLAEVHDGFHSPVSFQDKANRSPRTRAHTSPSSPAYRPRLEPQELAIGQNGAFDYCNDEGKRVRCFYYLPNKFSRGTPCLFVMHGLLRNATDYFRRWTDKGLPDKRHFCLIVPEFSKVVMPSCTLLLQQVLVIARFFDRF